MEVLPIADITALSLRARLAIALRLFADYSERRGLAHPDIAAYLDYLWRFIGLSGLPEAFQRWEEDQPPLIEVGLGGKYPPGFEAILSDRGVADREFRQAVSFTTEVLWCSMYAAADESGSRRFVGESALLVVPLGVKFPDVRPFAGSRWADGHGWGAFLSTEAVAAWRRTSDAWALRLDQ